MSETPTRSGWGYVVIAIVAITLLYPLSFGPACWISQRTGGDGTVVSVVYQPVLQIAWRCPQPVGGCLLHYSRIGMEPSCCEMLWEDEVTGYCRWGHTTIYACIW